MASWFCFEVAFEHGLGVFSRACIASPLFPAIAPVQIGPVQAVTSPGQSYWQLTPHPSFALHFVCVKQCKAASLSKAV